MSFKYADRVKESSSTSGLGALTLGGAVAGFQSFATAGYANGDTCYYEACDQSGTDWETGLGTYQNNTIVRPATPLSSSNGGAKVNFSSGSLFVFVTVPSAALAALASLSGINTGDQDLTGLLQRTNNLSDVLSASASRTNLGLGNVQNVDTTSTANIADAPNKRFVTDAQKTQIANALQAGNNLSDLQSAAGARTNLGLGSAATLTAGSANGAATLDSSGKLASAQIPAALVGAVVYQGTWNASTNSPTLVSSAGTKGFYYKVSVAGTTTIDGISQWNIGDTIIFDGTTWDKIDGVANEVVSVNGRTGSVVLTATDVSLPIPTSAGVGSVTNVYQNDGFFGPAAPENSNILNTINQNSIYASAQAATGTLFDFIASQVLPTGWTYSRFDSVVAAGGFSRSSTGQGQFTGNGTARFDFDINGNPLGLRMDPSRTNRCTNENLLPADTSGVSVTGTATASVVTDATALTAYKLNGAVTGNVFQVSGGASGGTAVIAGGTGATGAFSASLVARITAGTSCSFGITPSPTAATISGSAYATFKAENLASTASTDTLVITVPANTTVLFILNQLEAGTYSTYPIRVSGAIASRADATFGDLSILTRSYFSQLQGTIVMDFVMDNVTTNTKINRLILLTDSTNGVTDCKSVHAREPSTRRRFVPQFTVGRTAQYNADAGSYDAAGQRMSVAISWIEGVVATVYNGANAFTTFPLSGSSPGINRAYFGCRGATAENLSGWIRSIKFYPSYRNPALVGLDLVKASENVFHTIGQSNVTTMFSAQSGTGVGNNSGEYNFIQQMNSYFPSARNWFANEATVGTSVIYYPTLCNDTNFWLDLVTLRLGAPYRRWMEIAKGLVNGTSKAIIDICGESDSGNSTLAQFYTAMAAKHAIAAPLAGFTPVIFVPIGYNSSGNDGYQISKETIWSLCSNNPTKFFRAPERFDLATSDGLHMSDASGGTYGTRLGRFVAKTLGASVTGGVSGASIASVNRSGNTWTVTLTHDAGATDFTPTTNIAGFEIFIGADYTTNANPVTAAVRTNATTITLTTSLAQGGTLYYAKGTLSTQIQANLVRDNSTYQLPLQAAKFTVA